MQVYQDVSAYQAQVGDLSDYANSKNLRTNLSTRTFMVPIDGIKPLSHKLLCGGVSH